jgi:hypothetical protein
MVAVANSASTTPIRTHTYAAMKSGNATMEEMQEFVLQYAIHGGWPKASVMRPLYSKWASWWPRVCPTSEFLSILYFSYCSTDIKQHQKGILAA